LHVLIIEDSGTTRRIIAGILRELGYDVTEAENGRDAVHLAQQHKPDVAVLDLMMPLLNGLDAGREILQNGYATAAILLTMHTQEHQIAMALRAGVRGYLLKTQAAEDLVHAIREVLRGEIYLSPGVSRIVVDGYLSGDRPAGDPLAPRERQVLQLVAEGKTSKEVAVLLGLTVKTAESYRARVMEKLGVHETAGLVRYAIRHGIIDA